MSWRPDVAHLKRQGLGSWCLDWGVGRRPLAGPGETQKPHPGSLGSGSQIWLRIPALSLLSAVVINKPVLVIGLPRVHVEQMKYGSKAIVSRWRCELNSQKLASSLWWNIFLLILSRVCCFPDKELGEAGLKLEGLLRTTTTCSVYVHSGKQREGEIP